MATNGFSFEELTGPTAERKPAFVPADRTSKKPPTGLSLDDVGGVSDKVGTLPKDRIIYDTIRAEAKNFGVPEEFLFALADQESGYNPQAKNDEFGATGIMQYIPETAKKRGIDPSDPVASIRAAAEDFATAMNEGGVDWAVKHHFAGPDTKGHGPKTRQYLADVTKRAQDIRTLLDSEGEGNPAAIAGVGGGSDAGPKQLVGFSFDELQSTETPPEEQEQGGVSSPVAKKTAARFLGLQQEGLDVLEETAEKSWNFIKQRISDRPGEYLGRPVRRFQRMGEKQVSELTAGMSKKDADVVASAFGGGGGFTDVRLPSAQEESAKISAKHNPQATAVRGFLDNLDAPAKLMLKDSLPANLWEAAINAPDDAYDKLTEANKIVQQYGIVRNPDKFPAVTVEAARRAIAQRELEQEDSTGVRQTWDNLLKLAKEDPGGIAAQFVNAVIADPELLMAPEGIGVRLVAGAKKVATGADVASKVVKIADRVVDAAGTNAALNLGIEAASAASEGRTLTGGEARSSAALGAVFGGTLAGLSGVIGRGAKAVDNIKAGKVGEADLQNALREAAEAETIADEIIRDPNPIDASVRHQIEQSVGIKFESEADLKAYLDTTRKEWKKLFKDRDLNGQYQAALYEERITRRTQLAEDAEARRANTAAEAAKQQEIAQAYEESQLTRTQRFSDEYEKALAAREEARAGDEESAAMAENQLRDATAKLDQQDIMESALDGDVPAIRNAMLRATQRDAKLARPKWQRGEVNQKLLASLGVGSLFAGTAFALAPEEQKLQAAFAGGLAGLILPKGGSVLSRMRQAGAISSDGELFALTRLVKEGKMKPTRELEELKARETELITLARRGDQRAYKELHDDNYKDAERFARKFTRGTDIDPEDVVQESFVKAFQNLDKFQEGTSFGGWFYTIVKNTASNMRRESQRGGSEFDIQSAELPDMVTAHGERYSRDAFDEGAGAILEDTPENQKIREDSEKIIANRLETMTDRKRQTFILNKIEGYTAEEIAQATNQNLSTVLMQLKSAQEEVLEAVQRGFGAQKRQTLPDEPKRGRGRPRKQSGEIDPTWLKTAAILGVGGTAGAAFADKNKIIGAIAGAGAGLLLFGGGAKGLKAAGQFADDVYGASSTRIMNKSRAIHKHIVSTERRILEQVHHHIEQVDPFLVRLNKMPKEGADILARALMTGKGAVIDKILTALGDVELTNSYKAVRRSLDSLGDQLVNLKRFSRGNIEYFPRIVKDKEGLFRAIGKVESDKLQAVLQDAHTESLRKNGRPLSEIEESAIINQMLFVDKRSVQPGFTKQRGIEEITPELQKYYSSPAESLHTYIRAAVQDIEAAKFFGGNAKNMKRGNHEFLDVDRSVKNMIAEEVQSGKLSNEDAREVADILRARFKEGMRSENDLIRNIKNIGNIGLLGNFWSAATQMADVGVQVYTQGLRSTLESVVRQVTGKKLVDMKDFGLADHISEEFAGQLRTTRWVNRVFRATLFAGIDKFGKNTALNAAIINAKRLVQTDSGMQRLANRYQEAFGNDFSKLVSELKSGKISDLTRDYAFMELSRSQPVTRIEMPLAYLKHPNMRSYLWLKSFTMKQLDLVRREAYNEIKAGHVARGLKNLTELGVILGISGATTDMVKSWMLGKDTELKASDIPVNMFKTFGFSEYMRDQFAGVSKEEAAERRKAGNKGARAKKAEPISAIASSFTPPFRMFDQLLSGDPRAIRYLVPGLGPYLAEQVKKENDMRKEVNKK